MDESNNFPEHDEDVSEDGTDFRIYCIVCDSMIEPSQYTQHIHNHVNVLNNLVTSRSSMVSLPHLDSLMDFPPLTSLLSMRSLRNLTTNNRLPTLSQMNEDNEGNEDNENNEDIQGVSFSNITRNLPPLTFPFSLPQTLNINFQYTVLDDSIFDDYETNMYLADLVGNVEVGVDDINNVSKIIDKDTLDDDTVCPICIENIKETDGIGSCRELLCKHIYCDKCISKWWNTSKKCPVCKKDLEELYLLHKQQNTTI